MDILAAAKAFGMSDEERSLIEDVKSVIGPFVGAVITDKLSLWDVADTLRGAKLAPPWMVKVASLVESTFARLPDDDAAWAILDVLLKGRTDTVVKLVVRFAPICGLQTIVDPGNKDSALAAVKELSARIVASDKSLQPLALCICPRCDWRWAQMPSNQ